MHQKPLYYFLAALMSLAGLAFAQQPHIVSPNGQRVDVEKIRARPNGDLVVTMLDGQPREVAKGQYLRAVGVKPDGFDEAVAQILGGDYDTGASELRGIMRKAQFQSWDAQAGKVLIEAALANGKTADATRTYKQLTDRYGQDLAKVYPDMEVLVWKINIVNGDTDGLDDKLTTILKEDPSRLRRGMAQIARGDMKYRTRDFQAAVLDYLRGVYFYPDVASVHAEALYKTAEAFAAIGDTGRMRTYQQQLKQQYPNSPYSMMDVGN